MEAKEAVWAEEESEMVEGVWAEEFEVGEGFWVGEVVEAGGIRG